MPKEKNDKSTIQSTTVGVQLDNINRYAKATAEDVVAYTGVRVQDNNTIFYNKKSLEEISTYKVDDSSIISKNTNIDQQSGFSAEIVYAKDRNKEAIIKGENTRFARTDDTFDASGRRNVNDPKGDITSVDKGDLLHSDGKFHAQMKFTNNPEKMVKGIIEGENQRYKDEILLVPDEQYDDYLQSCDKRVKQLQDEIEHAPLSSKAKNVKLQQIEEYKKLKTNIKKSNLNRRDYESRANEYLQESNKLKNENKLNEAEKYYKKYEKEKKLAEKIKENQDLSKNKTAESYRNNPTIEIIKDISSTANDISVNAAKMTFALSATTRVIQNCYAVFQDKKDIQEAFKDSSLGVIKDTSISYASTYGTVVVQGTGQQAYGLYENYVVKETLDNVEKNISKKAKEMLKEEAKKKASETVIGKTLLDISNICKTPYFPVALNVCIQNTQNLKKFISGDLSLKELSSSVADTTLNIMSASYTATVASIIFPEVAIATFIGGVIGSTLCSICSNLLKNILSTENIAIEKRIMLEYEIACLRKASEKRIAELKTRYAQFFKEEKEIFEDFELMLQQNNSESIDVFIAKANKLVTFLNTKLEYQNKEEFEQCILEKKTFYF